jgi:hypothetical protein
MSDLQELRQAIDAVGSIRAAGRLLGIPESTIRSRLGRASVSEYEVEPVEPIDAPIEELLEERFRKFDRLKEGTNSAFVRQVRLKTNAPIGLGFFGDPHVDDDGTNLRKLLDHARLFDGRTEGLYGALLGDVANNWVGKLERLWADQSVNHREAFRLTEHFLQSVMWLFVVWGNHDCNSMDTQALTKRGWVEYSGLRDDDEVLGFNPETEAAEWQPILSKFSRPHNQPMVEIKNQHVDALVTRGHRVLHHVHKQKGWKYVEAKDFAAHKWQAIRCAAITDNKPYGLSDDYLRLAGWLLTDAGRGPTGGWTIYQSKPDHVLRIRELLDRLGFSYKETVRDRDITEVMGRTLLKRPLPAHEFSIHMASSRLCDELVPDRRTLPAWVFELSVEQFNILLDTIIDADGCWDGVTPEDKKCGVVHKTKEFLDSLQAACVAFGWRTLLSCARDHDWRLSICSNPESIITTSVSVNEVPAVDRVWCLSVPLTNFMVRRNGKAHFTGNCWNQKIPFYDYLVQAHTKITAAHEQRVKLIFPNGREVMIHARHKFPGHSQWTKQFGQIKAAMLGGTADIYIGGDKHVSGYSNGWHDGQKRMWHAVQVASYKEIDEYPVELGLTPADLFQCPVAVINPNAEGPLNFIQWVWEPEEGAARVAWERGRWSNG